MRWSLEGDSMSEYAATEVDIHICINDIMGVKGAEALHVSNTLNQIHLRAAISRMILNSSQISPRSCPQNLISRYARTGRFA